MNRLPVSAAIALIGMVATFCSTCTTGGGTACDGVSTGCILCETSTDCPVPATACIVAVCNGGTCATMNAQQNTPCNDDGGKLCDGAGTCVACIVDADCGLVIGGCQDNVCVAATCTNGLLDGSETFLDCGGSCPPCPNNAPCKVPGDCTSGVCDVNRCRPCGFDADCGAASYCDTNTATCTTTKANGDVCAAGNQCASGNCVDSVCCESASCPACNACDVNGLGVCAPILAGPDTTAPNTCDKADVTCDGLGRCLEIQGESCAADDECLSGHCVDGVCCESASCSACNACNLTGNGTCSPMANGADETAPNTCNGATTTCDGAGACKKNPGQTCALGTECATALCVGGVCAAKPPSCVGGDAGTNMACGASGADDCCASLLVPGGSFLRGYDAAWYTDPSFPATVSSFRLDKYEVTVGRFRKFVAAVLGGWRPPNGSGKHTHLAGGGLNGGNEMGWDPAWNAALATTKAAWDANLMGGDHTWSPTPDAQEKRPLNFATWKEAYAFCIWDGGFLPSDAEWNYAASGGSEQRVYPWSNPATSLTIDCTYANFKPGAFCSPTLTNDVGSESSKGDGRWGHADLAGNLWELTLDGGGPYPMPCNDCSIAVGAMNLAIMRGGGWLDGASGVLNNYRLTAGSSGRDSDLGFRCARVP